jgi:isopentenyl phosphate kinase
VKIGGSVATDKEKEKTLRPNVLGAVAEALRSALDEGELRLLLGHGGGSYGHFPAQKYEVKKGVHPQWGFDGFQITRGWMTELNGKIRATFASKGLRLFPIQPSSCVVCESGRIASFETGTIEALLAFGKIPVVWGDAVLDRNLGFTIVSTETILDHLSRTLRPQRVVALTNVDGVFEEAGRVGEEGGAPIARVDRTAFERLQGELARASGVDVTGGMLEKVSRLLHLAEALPESQVHIVNGFDPAAVKGAVLGTFRGGTLLVPPSGENPDSVS